MPPIGYVVFDADGKAGIHCGNDHDGNEIVAWVGKPEVCKADVDDNGNGEAAYTTVFPAPKEDEKQDNSRRRF